MTDNGKQTGTSPQYPKRDMLRLQLAAQLASQNCEQTRPEQASRRPRSRVQRAPVGQKSVLVVDDEPSVLELVSVSLTARNYCVYTASSVAEARVALQAHSDLSLVITDLKMPGEDGFTLLEYIRSNLRFRHIPAVVFTSCSDQRYVMQAAELGAQAFLLKPFTADSLIERVSEVLEATTILIVLVTTDSTTRTILGRDLTLAGYTVSAAENGEQALEMMTSGKGNVIIADLVLDDMTGLDLLGRVSESCSSVPFLFISDPLLRVSEEVVKAAGGHGLIRRPFRNSELLQLMKSLEARLHGRYGQATERESR